MARPIKSYQPGPGVEPEALYQFAPPRPDGSMDLAAACLRYQKRGPQPDDIIRPYECAMLDGSIVIYLCQRGSFPPRGQTMREVANDDGSTTLKFVQLQ